MENKQKILLLDNYDSFTYNLYQYFIEITDVQVIVRQNDEISLQEVEDYDVIVISPGPGLPSDTPLLSEIIEKYYKSKPILGVCLGLQAITETFGGSLNNLEKVYHGIKSPITMTEHSDHSLLRGIDEQIYVGRYHSWVVNPEDVHADFQISSYSEDGHIMSMRHKDYCLEGVQFHPESMMTTEGQKMLGNFLDSAPF